MFLNLYDYPPLPVFETTYNRPKYSDVLLFSKEEMELELLINVTTLRVEVLNPSRFPEETLKELPSHYYYLHYKVEKQAQHIGKIFNDLKIELTKCKDQDKGKPTLERLSEPVLELFGEALSVRLNEYEKNISSLEKKREEILSKICPFSK